MNAICKTAPLLLALMAAAAQAQEATPDSWLTEFRAERSRAELRAELMQAHASGEYALVAGEAHEFMPMRRGTVTVSFADGLTQPVALLPADGTRAAVELALYQARSSGELARMNGEAWDFTLPAGAARPDTIVAMLRR